MDLEQEEAWLEQSRAALDQLFRAVVERSYRESGAGSFHSQYQMNLSKIDRFNYKILTPNSEFSGLTFISRPKLNLTSTNLRQDRVMTALDTDDPLSVAFMIRCLLDTKLSQDNNFMNLVRICPLLDERNPFMVPLMNNLHDISGFPDFVIDTHDTEGGFFNENMTMAIGSDDNNRSFDLNLNVRDIQGGIIAAMMHHWLRYIHCVKKGEMVAYAEDINERKRNYTVSIYRFLLDPSKRFITKWAKATGCFPKSLPTGSFFNTSSGETFVKACAEFSIPFACNDFKPNDPAILMDFNSLVETFCPTIVNGMYTAPVQSKYNFIGIPYIVDSPEGLKLEFRYDPTEVQDNFDEIVARSQAIADQRETFESSSTTSKLTNPTTPVSVPANTEDVVYA